MACSTVRRFSASPSRTIRSSPTASPETTRSPRPRAAVTITSSRLPVTGLAVNATPAASGLSIRCTRTAISREPVSARSARYCWTRMPAADARTRAIAADSASHPRTPRTVSYWPANDASARSSATADDRTASGSSPRRSAAARTASSGSPIIANPSGTAKPARTSSPRFAALPPVSPTSARVSSASGTILRVVCSGFHSAVLSYAGRRLRQRGAMPWTIVSDETGDYRALRNLPQRADILDSTRSAAALGFRARLEGSWPAVGAIYHGRQLTPTPLRTGQSLE